MNLAIKPRCAPLSVSYLVASYKRGSCLDVLSLSRSKSVLISQVWWCEAFGVLPLINLLLGQHT
jgi:hypothetical protein